MRVIKRLLVLSCVFTLVSVVHVTPFCGLSSAYAGYEKIKINIKGMEDYASTIKVKKALKRVKGVKKAYVDFKNERAIVTVKKGTDTGALLGAIKETGYKAYLPQEVKTVKQKKKEVEGDPYENFNVDPIVGKDPMK
ncbi:MAG: heavy-metal-associated domain-containing protein [Planctomycetes bacterium]|nr:heavy-metal-associated domain-containing protein [Planctomycetota bacterium]